MVCNENMLESPDMAFTQRGAGEVYRFVTAVRQAFLPKTGSRSPAARFAAGCHKTFKIAA
jgi:hypothetical protein